MLIQLAQVMSEADAAVGLEQSQDNAMSSDQAEDQNQEYSQNAIFSAGIIEEVTLECVYVSWFGIPNVWICLVSIVNGCRLRYIHWHR